MKKNKPTTPRLADWLITRFIEARYGEEFFGDLEEMYRERLTHGKFRAWLLYWVDVIHLLLGFSSARMFQTNHDTMITASTFKVAWRNALKQKQFTLINLSGLTLGIATCLTIGLYTYHEMTFDIFHAKGDRIYRVNQPMIWTNWDTQFASTGPGVATALREDVPEFEQVTRLLADGEQVVRVPAAAGSDAALYAEKRCFAADDNFFEVFSFPFIAGDPATALKKPMSMVIPRKTAVRYFGDEKKALDKTVEIRQKDGTWTAYTIRGVLMDIPAKSHLQFDALTSMSSYSQMMEEQGWKWIWTAFSTYGLVKEGTDIPALTLKIQALPPKWAATTTERIFNQTFSEYTAGKVWRLYLQPLRKIYLSDAPAGHRFGPTGNPLMVTVFSAVGILVLILSSINFMNLSTARSFSRAKEVTIRKVLGSRRNTLIRQFIIEATLYVIIGTMLALAVVQLLLPVFNTLAERQLTLVPHFGEPLFIGGILFFIILLSLAAGSYPAFYLSAVQPLETLKGKGPGGMRKSRLRDSLIVFQFAVSIGLVCFTLVVQKQLRYSESMDLGFSRNNILQIHDIEQLKNNDAVLRTRLEGHPALAQVAKSFSVPPFVWEGERYKTTDPGSPVGEISNLRVDEKYLPLLGVEFLAGRNFDPNRPSDKYGIVLNEEAVKVLGWGTRETYGTSSPIGKFVVQAFDREEKLEVIGVVKNFNFNSVKQKIDPLMIVHHHNDKFWNYGLGNSYFSIRLDPKVVKTRQDIGRVIDVVKAEMARIDNSILFEYSFMDQSFDETFREEQKMESVLNIFTLLALVIACLGLFGLAAYASEQRKKELSIRKVHGAQVHQLVWMFSLDFARLILWAVAIASPVAYFFANRWLNGFAHHTVVGIWIFLAAAGGALVIAMGTISFQSIAAARANPVDTLRSDA
jgi:putative ABC transport system permease protein